MDTEIEKPIIRTRKNSKLGSQPRERAAHISLTVEQHQRLTFLSSLFFVSNAQLLRTLIDEKWVQVKSTLPPMTMLPPKGDAEPALTEDSQVSSGV